MPKRLLVTVSPLEVVEQRPHEMSTHHRAFTNGASYCVHTSSQIVDATRVGHDAVFHLVRERGAIFGHVDSWRLVALLDTDQQLTQSVRYDRPAHLGEFETHSGELLRS